MSRSTFRLGGLAVAGLLLALAGTARAAEDDFEFADALARRGYTDLAAEIFNNLISDPKSTTARKASGQYGLALLTYGDARVMAAERNEKRRAQMADVLKKFDEADAAFAKFIQENGTHERILEARLSRGKLLQDKAEYVKVCVENGWLTAGTNESAWMKQVADWFDTAIGLFEAAEKNAKDGRDKHPTGSDEWEDANDQFGLIWLYRISTLYGKGAALPKGDPAGTAALESAIKQGSDDYQWEFGESVRGLWAIHFAGLACAALDKPSEALAFLGTASSFSAERDSSPAIQDITFQSYAQLGKWCLKFGRRDKTDYVKKALEAFTKMQRDWPEWRKNAEGQRAGLVWAKILAQTGQGEAAMKLVQDVVKASEASGSNVRFEATRALGDLIARGGGSGGGGLDPATLFKIARNKYNEQDYRGSIRAFQAVLSNCRTPEEWDTFGWDSWDYVGRGYGASGRFYEAFLAFDQIEQAWKKDKNNEKLAALTDETGYSRAAALDALARKTKDGGDREKAKKAIDDFANDHPTSPRNQNAQDSAATNKLKDADGLRADPVAYRAALAEALKAFESLDAGSKMAFQNRATIAQIHFKMATADPAELDAGELATSIQLADAWLAQKRPEITDSTVRRAWETGRRTALLVALSARAERNASMAKSTDRAAATAAAEDLVSAIDRLGADFKEVAANGQLTLDQWRAEGLIGAGKVNEADQLVGKLLQESPANRNNPYLAGIVAAALQKLAQQRASIGDDNGAKALFLRSARRSEWVLDNLKLKDGSPAPRNPDVIRAVAQRFSKGGDFPKAEALLNEAQKSYEDASAAAASPEDKDANLKRARACRIELIGLLVEQAKYDAAIPQLEKEIAADPKARAEFLKRIQTTDNITDADYKTLIDKTDANAELLNQLSAAYLRAPSKERAYAAVNLSYILTLTMPKDERHGEAWIDYLLRRGESYLVLAEYTRQPEHYRQAQKLVQNSVIIPGHLDGYEQTLPGSKKRAETIVGKAEDGLRKLGTK